MKTFNYMEQAVRKAIANLDRGTVGIGNDCLWQLTVRYIDRELGPKGTNAAFIARQDFDAVISQKPYSRFVYKQ